MSCVRVQFCAAAIALVALTTHGQAAETAAKKQFELGELITTLIPLPSEKLTWEFRANSDIEWITSGFAEQRRSDGQVTATRTGVVAVNVMGRQATVLRKKLEELPWTVSMRTTAPAKFGPTEIHISPGSPTESCFGTLYSGCDFEVEASLRKSGIEFREVCGYREAGDSVKAYQLKTAVGGTAYLVESSSGGSGGSSTELTIALAEETVKEACSPEWRRE